MKMVSKFPIALLLASMSFMVLEARAQQSDADPLSPNGLPLFGSSPGGDNPLGFEMQDAKPSIYGPRPDADSVGIYYRKSGVPPIDLSPGVTVTPSEQARRDGVAGKVYDRHTGELVYPANPQIASGGELNNVILQGEKTMTSIERTTGLLSTVMPTQAMKVAANDVLAKNLAAAVKYPKAGELNIDGILSALVAGANPNQVRFGIYGSDRVGSHAAQSGGVRGNSAAASLVPASETALNYIIYSLHQEGLLLTTTRKGDRILKIVEALLFFGANPFQTSFVGMTDVQNPLAKKEDALELLGRLAGGNGFTGVGKSIGYLMVTHATASINGVRSRSYPQYLSQAEFNKIVAAKRSCLLTL